MVTWLLDKLAGIKKLLFPDYASVMLSIKTKIVKFKSAKLSKEILFKNNSVLQELIRKECRKTRSFTLRVNTLELKCLQRPQGKDMDHITLSVLVMGIKHPRTGSEVMKRSLTKNNIVRIGHSQ